MAVSGPNLTGKVIAVTGGASGIGRETVKLLAFLGAKVSVADVSPVGLQMVVDEIQADGGSAMSKIVDIRDEEAVNCWIQETVAWGGKLDGAANLAGVVGRHPGSMLLKDYTDAEWDFILDINLKGLMHCLRAQLNILEPNGSIVNAASICGVSGEKGSSAYCASKHGVIGLTRSAAKECGVGQRVNCFAPGSIDTPMTRKYADVSGEDPVGLAAMKRLGKPREVADAIAFLLSENSSFISGTVLHVDGAWFC